MKVIKLETKEFKSGNLEYCLKNLKEANPTNFVIAYVDEDGRVAVGSDGESVLTIIGILEKAKHVFID